MQHPIVLVHGALTDASVWSAVTLRLQRAGHRVLAPAMPLRGLRADAAYLERFLASVEGDAILVGHSYAGAVISQVHAPNVASLVFVAAFQPDTGETAGGLNERFPGSMLGPATTMVQAAPDGPEIYLKPECFRDVYAGDVEPAWRTLPSWALVATEDRSIPAEALRFMARRAGSRIAEVASSHAAPVAHPDAVVMLIDRAIRGEAS